MPACLEHFSRRSSSCLSWLISSTTRGFCLESPNATKLSTCAIAVHLLVTAGTESSSSVSSLISGISGRTGSLSPVDARDIASSLSMSANAWRDTSPITVWRSGSRDGWSTSMDGRLTSPVTATQIVQQHKQKAFTLRRLLFYRQILKN